MAIKHVVPSWVCLAAALIFVTTSVHASQNNSICRFESESSIEASQIIELWPDGAPGSEQWAQQEVEHDLGFGGPPNRIVRNVTTPTLTAYLPDQKNATGSAVVIAPGGGFLFLSVENEGHMLARCLASQGIAAFVLKYRLVQTPGPEDEFRRYMFSIASQANGALEEGKGLFARNDFASVVNLGVGDAMKALSLVRSKAERWGIMADRVGLLGFSAGARITAGAILAAEESARPDFAGLIYGGLFGEAADLSAPVPPVFAAVAADDALALATTRDFVDALLAVGSKPEFHLYSTGGHGFGMVRQNKSSDQWLDSWLRWMVQQALLPDTSK